MPGLSGGQIRDHYYLSANVLKASEDKTFPGAIVASLASPWGQSVPAGADASRHNPSYFGSYREVFARDLYEAFTGLLADGDIATARAATLFLFDRQQLANGSMPRNSLVNGKAAPDTGGDQLDEASYPILMALLSGLGGDTSLCTRPHPPRRGLPGRQRAVLRGGALGGAERLLTVHDRGRDRGPDRGRRRSPKSTATPPGPSCTRPPPTTSSACIKTWTVTTTGPDGPPYFIRLSKTGDPNAAITYSLGNGGPTVDQRSVIDGGFQELVRLGELPVSDPDVQASLAVLDKQISVDHPERHRLLPLRQLRGRRAAPTVTATATSPARPPAPLRGPRGRRPTSAPGTCGRSCPASGPSPTWPRATPAARQTCSRP